MRFLLIFGGGLAALVAAADEATVETTNDQGHGGLILKSSDSNLLLVSCLDGSLHALDPHTGHERWVSEELGGPLLHGSPSDLAILRGSSEGGSQANDNDEPFYLIEPLFPGHLYLFPGHSPHLRRVPLSIRNMINQAPLRWPDGTVYLGSKTTHYYALDATEGRLLYHGHEPDRDDADFYEGEEVLLIARTEYNLVAHREQQPLWNVTFAELTGIAPPTVLWRRNPEDGSLVEVDPDLGQLLERRMKPDGVDLLGDFSTNSAADSLLQYQSSFTGSIYARDRLGNLQWSRQFASPALTLLLAVEGGRWVHHLAWTPASSSSSDQLVNVGNFNGVLFVLPQSLYQRNDDSGEEDYEGGVGMLRLIPPSVEVGEIPGTGQDAHRWPLLPGATPQNDAFWLPWFMAIAVIIVTTWWLYRRRRQSRTTLSQDNRESPSVQSPSGKSQSGKSQSGQIHPPGFEEVSRGTADRLYAKQAAEAGDAPRSFTLTDQILGYGSHGTVVFRGEFDGREVAVKRMLLDFYQMAGQEVSLLQSADHHPNVIRYYWREQTDRFMYICLELCPATLTNLVEGPDGSLWELVGDGRHVIRQLLSGLAHLHSLGIVHRDLKPGNILINRRGTVLISDFGLSRRLVGEESSFHPTMHTGTTGWRAPELLLSDEVVKSGLDSLPRVNRSLDVWAAGLLVFYVLSGGLHPFGERLEREANIARNSLNLSALQEQPEAMDLVTRMLRRDPSQRPTAAACLNHPWFWDAARCLAFLAAVSDRLESEDRHSYSPARRLESMRNAILDPHTTWHQQLHPELWADLSAFRRYSPHSIQDLLRAIRNKRSHLNELPLELQQAIGISPEAYWSYWQTRFPRLLITVYQVVEADERIRNRHPFGDDFCK